MNEPVRVRIYGLVRVTRSTYLILQIVSVAMVTVLLALGMFLPRPALAERQRLPSRVRLLAEFLDRLPWLALLLLVLVGLETLVVLKKFARAEQQARDGDRSPG